MLNIGSHSILRSYLNDNKLFVHALWFNIYDGELHLFSRKRKMFIRINVSLFDFNWEH